MAEAIHTKAGQEEEEEEVVIVASIEETIMTNLEVTIATVKEAL